MSNRLEWTIKAMAGGRWFYAELNANPAVWFLAPGKAELMGKINAYDKGQA